MSTKKKLLIAIVAVSVTLLMLVITMIVVLVASVQEASSNVVVEYVSTSVSADVSSNLGGTALYSGDDTVVQIRPGTEKTCTFTASQVDGAGVNPYEVVIKNVNDFANISVDVATTATVSYSYNVEYFVSPVEIESLDPTTVAGNGLTQCTDQVLTANAAKDSTMYIYIVISGGTTTNHDGTLNITVTLERL